MKSCDLLLHSNFCLPISPQNDLFEKQTIAIKNGEIVEVGDTKTVIDDYEATQNLDLPNHLIMPGLINGYIEPIETFNERKGGPKQIIEAKHIAIAESEKSETQLTTEILLSKMIKSGTTTFAQIHEPKTDIVNKANFLGIRTQLAVPITKERSYDHIQQSGLSHVLETHDEFKHDPLVGIAFGIQNPDTLSPIMAEKIAILANEIHIPIRTICDAEFFNGQTPSRKIKQPWLPHFAQIGLLGPHFQLIQMSQLGEKELELLSNNGSKVIHCPSSSVRQAKAYTSLQTLRNKGINVGLGLERTAVNDSLCLLSEAKIASLLSKHEDQDSCAASLDDLIHMLTLGGAHALGVGNITGSIEPGKQADLIAINLENFIFNTKETLLSELIYGDLSRAIDYVFVSGKALLEKRGLTQIDEDELNHKIRQIR